MKKSQFAMEYLIMVGVVFVILIPLIIIYFGHAKATEEQLAMQKLEETGTQLTKEAELVYYAGGYSKKTIEIDMPKSIKSIRFTGSEALNKYELVFIVETNEGKQEKVFEFNVPIIADIPENIEEISKFVLKKTSDEKKVLLCTNIQCTEP